MHEEQWDSTCVGKRSQPDVCTIVQYIECPCTHRITMQNYYRYTMKIMWKYRFHKIASEVADLCCPHLCPQQPDLPLTRLLPSPLRLSICVIPACMLSTRLEVHGSWLAACRLWQVASGLRGGPRGGHGGGPKGWWRHEGHGRDR